MNAEDCPSVMIAHRNRSESSSISLLRVFETQRFSDKAFSPHGEENRASELLEAGEFSEDGQVIGGAFGKAEAWVDDYGLEREPGGLAQHDFVLKEFHHGSHDVLPLNMAMADLGRTDRVHEEEGCSRIGTETGIVVIGEPAHIIDELGAHRQGGCHDLASPGIEREDGRPNL